jgi:GAF domain-containing protein
VATQFNPAIHLRPVKAEAAQIKGVLTRMNRRMEQDDIVQNTVDQLREFLQVERVILYHFYREWEGQVTFESLQDRQFSVLGMKGPDECFNHEYADLYLAGRVRAIANIMTEPIEDCHRDFLSHLQVRANLVVPILPNQRLWGLLIAHACQTTRDWSTVDIEKMKIAAQTLATAPSIAF